jgi:hypothetical protein
MTWLADSEIGSVGSGKGGWGMAGAEGKSF